MSRGFDGFEIDDFRDSGWERDSRGSKREPSRGSSGISATDRSTAQKLERLRETEQSLDAFNRVSQERSNQTRPPLPREERQRSTLSSSRKAIYTDRDKSYSLRDSEVHTLSEVGRFRVVDAADLAQFAYSGERSRMERDVHNLVSQGLVEQRGTSVMKQDSGRAQARGDRDSQRLKESFARELHLPVVHGKVSFPDLRIEYATQEMEIARVDLELATRHYHAGHLAEKARAGFQLYARSEDTAGLRRVRDEREITVAILSL